MKETGSMGQRIREQKESTQLSLLGQNYIYTQEGTVGNDPLSPGTNVLNQ